MSKIVVLAEKPSVGRDIARVLKCNKKVNGGLEGGAYIVTWGLGHLVTLSDPEKYDEKYKEWKLEYLPMIPTKMKLEVIRQTGKQYQAVKSHLLRKDVTEVVIATDAGREGELVARWILEKAGCHKPLKRLWISSVTDKAIRDGFANLKTGKAYENLYHAAASRAEADWVVGINATRALTCKYNAQLSCGRVQTPTLAMIAKRELEIKEFTSKSYYGIKAFMDGICFQWEDAMSGNNRSFDKSRVEQVLKMVDGKGATVAALKKTAKKTYAPLLYDLTELQRDANKKFHYSAKETLNIMQRLYENHKVLTYPRTDSRYLTKDVVGTIRERLEACGVGPYRSLAVVAKRSNLSGKLSFVDDQKVSDHHAIIPTEQYVQLDHMTIDERRIYDLVVRRFLAVLYPPFLYEQTNIEITCGGELFTAKGKVIQQRGWKEVYENQTIDEDDVEILTLPQVTKGDHIQIQSYTLTEGKTTPPPLFNEGTLLSAMEHPAKYMESKKTEDIKMLGETGGLGTVATRADIIEKLFKTFLIEKQGNDIRITSKGRQLLELVPEDLKKPELTADWERKLSEIADGRETQERFISEIRSYAETLIEGIKVGNGTFRHDNLTKEKCPDCGKYLLLVKGKNSTMKVCQDRACGYRETVSRTSNARCPKCHKKMELLGKGDAQTFICKCGYKEKLANFTERRKKEGAGVSKKDVQKYLNQNKKDEPVNLAFAEAFKNIKL